MIAYSHNPFFNVPHITFHHTQAKTTLCNKKNASSATGQTISTSVCVSIFFSWISIVYLKWLSVAQENGARETQIMENPTQCCTFIAPQAVPHLQLPRQKRMSHLALQTKYRQFTQPHRHHTTVHSLSPTGIIQTVYSAPQAFWKYVYSAPQASCKYEYSAPQAFCKQYTQPHGHYANRIFSPTGIMQTEYSAPQGLNIMLCPTGKTASHTTGVIHNKKYICILPKAGNRLLYIATGKATR